MNRIIIVLLFVVGTQSAFGQGALSPSASPAPTMKSLDQVEPRIAITNLPYTITLPGSYYITTNLTVPSSANGIIILPDNVTVDLSGFTLFGTNGSGSGIYCEFGGHNYVIRNGTLRNWGQDGVFASGSINCRFENLQLYGNAVVGLQAGVGSVVVNCEATSNAVAGIQLAGSGGEISHCTAVGNGTGIVASTGCVVADCSASGNTSDGIDVGAGTGIRSCVSYQNGNNGITTSNNCSIIGCTVSTNSGFYSIGMKVGDNSTVNDCTASGNNLAGILVGNNCSVNDCTASGNDEGISVGNNCTVKDCTASRNSDNGIVIYGGQNRIDGNHVASNGNYGINPEYPNVTNSIIRNSAPGDRNPAYNNYAGNNDYAPTGSVSTATNPWTNF